MKQSNLFYKIFPFIILAIPWIYLSLIWDQLPQKIPTHFGISGSPDKFGEKNEILIAPTIVTVLGLLMYFIIRNIHKIDPKKKYKATTAGILSKLAIVTIIFLSGISLMTLYWTIKGSVKGIPILFCFMGLFFAYIGNLMHSIKPNYFAGFRIPWALENEDNWRKTHQLASKIWFTGGIILALISLLLNLKFLIPLFFILIITMTIIPVIYSYNLYRNSQKSLNTE